MGERPSGTVTFLFTDIEGSTRLWDADPTGMRVALAAHDDVFRDAIEAGGGWLFKHTGDGVCAAFWSAPEALRAAIDAPRRMSLPVRMGLWTGTAERRGDDYFGPALNRAARVMAAGHGGQILVAASTAGLADGFELLDLGERPLRDLSGVHRVFQLCAEGLRVEFPPLRTLDAVPGNLPVQTTSFVGRAAAVEELVRAVRTHRLVTLTGVGGVGKTRLALQVAGAVLPEFPDGVWLIELAPLGDPASVPDAVATALGVTPQAGRSVTDSIAQALAGRRLLVVLDNCEHVLDAAAALVETILTRTQATKVIATSREGLRLRGEHLWAVPSLGVEGAAAEGVELFVERAREVNARFSLDDPADADAVSAICRRVDGIALAIELAAARMVSMTPQDVLDRLAERFRLLAGGRRGVERHQTLRHAVGWSYDLLDGAEKEVLDHCAVFAGGFDVSAATHIYDGVDEFSVLDVLDSLVRKSLVGVEVVDGRARYGLLETIRQFAEERLAATADVTAVRDRHARYYAAQAVAYWGLWDGPRQREATDWVDVEFANLRAGFRWAADRHDLETATAVAAHTALLAWALAWSEPVGWAEEILDAATAAEVRQLPRLYTAASFCSMTRPDVAVGYAHRAGALDADSRYDGFLPGLSEWFEALAHFSAGRIDRSLEICAAMAADPDPGYRRTFGRTCVLWALPAVGRAGEARMMADETLAAARAHANPMVVAVALAGYGRAFSETDPPRALKAYRDGFQYCREHRLASWETLIAREAGLEGLHGSPAHARDLFDTALNNCLRAGDHATLAITLANLGMFFHSLGRPEVAATLYGASSRYDSIRSVAGLPDIVERLRSDLGGPVFTECVATGSAMDPGDAVAYAHHHINLDRHPPEPAT